jgi:hypothetical protein
MSNFFDDLIGLAKDVAPSVAGMATTVATGGNPAAGALVASIFERILGRKPTGKDDLEDMASEILGDPSKIQEFRLAMRQAELDELKIRTLDVQDARKLLTISKGAVYISILVVTGFFASVFVAMTETIPTESQNLAYLLIGTLASGFSSVLGYWLGSSQGSKQKTEILQSYAEASRIDQEARRRVAEASNRSGPQA